MSNRDPVSSRSPPSPSIPAGKETSIKYLCLTYDEEKAFETMPKTESDAMTAEYFAFTEGIKGSGHDLGGNARQPVQAAITVRVRNGKLSTTDGPFAETTGI